MGQRNNPELHKSFLEYDHQFRIGKVKIGCVLVMTLMPAGFSLDYFVYPEKIWPFFLLRVFSSILAGMAWYILTTPSGKRYVTLIGFVVTMLPVCFICWMIYITEGHTSTYYGGLNLVLIAVGFVFFWSFKETLILLALIFLTYIITCLSFGPIHSMPIFFNNLYFLILTIIIVVTGNYFRIDLYYREFSHRFELDKNRKMLEESNKKLIELDEMKSRFFANISHELRTPLTLILAPLEDLIQKFGSSMDNAYQETFHLMQRNAHRLSTLIDDLLNLIKLESGSIAIHRELTDIEKFIRGLVNSVQRIAEEKGVAIQQSISTDERMLSIDRRIMEKILLNLFINAIKFTPEGGKITVTTLFKEGSLNITVRDTGIGIHEHEGDKIFERFWQAQSEHTNTYHGTGIGLSIVKELVEAQNGTVSASGKPGMGTVVELVIPTEISSPKSSFGQDVQGLSRPSLKLSKDEFSDGLYNRLKPVFSNNACENKSGIQVVSDGIKAPKILIAEDESDMALFLYTQFSLNFQIMEVREGSTVREKAEHFQPDLIILDIMMPGKDGLLVCQEIRQSKVTADTPIIVVTARADEETKIAALSAGASDFLSKPFSTVELHVRTKNLLLSHTLKKDLTHRNQDLEATLEKLKNTESRLVLSEKMASLGQWSAGIIHEVNNPLNYGLSALHFLKERGKQLIPECHEEFNDGLNDIEEAMLKVNEIVSELKTFLYPKSEHFDQVDLASVTATAIRFIRYRFKDEIKMDVNVPQGSLVYGNKNALIQVLTNLLMNAFDALNKKQFHEEDPSITVHGTVQETIKLTIRDNGCGIMPDSLKCIFDTFYTTKEVGQGMGFGLSISYKIIQQHGGNISVSSKFGKYTEFVITLPLNRRN